MVLRKNYVITELVAFTTTKCQVTIKCFFKVIDQRENALQYCFYTLRIHQFSSKLHEFESSAFFSHLSFLFYVVFQKYSSIVRGSSRKEVHLFNTF